MGPEPAGTVARFSLIGTADATLALAQATVRKYLEGTVKPGA